MFVSMCACLCVCVYVFGVGWRQEDIERLLNSYLVKLYFPASSVRNGSEQHLLLAVDVGDQYDAHTALELLCLCAHGGGIFNLEGVFLICLM